MAARAGVEPTTLRLKVIVSTKAPPRSTMYDSNGKLELDNWTATCCSGAVVWYGGVAVPMVLKQINDLRKRSGKSQLSFQILLMLEGGGPDDIREDYLIKFPERADLLCASTALDTPLFLNIITSCSSFLTVA